MFTTAGKNEIRNWLYGSASTAPNAIAIGIGTTSVAVSQTALVTESTRKSFSTKSIAPQVVKFEALLLTTELTTSTIAEMGLFNSTTSTSGTMFVRNTFAPIQKTDSIEVQFEQRVEVN